jgi:hypothetical protein
MSECRITVQAVTNHGSKRLYQWQCPVAFGKVQGVVYQCKIGATRSLMACIVLLLPPRGSQTKTTNMTVGFGIQHS